MWENVGARLSVATMVKNMEISSSITISAAVRFGWEEGYLAFGIDSVGRGSIQLEWIRGCPRGRCVRD